MEHVEIIARRMAAKKMGLVKDVNGEKLPDDLWQQMLPAARNFLDEIAWAEYLEELASEIYRLENGE